MSRKSFNQRWTFYKQGQDTRQSVNLPHDAMIIEQRDANSLGGNALAFFIGGVYHYENTFDVPAEWSEKSITFEFEGVYRNSKVYINDTLAGGSPYGYIPFFVNADEYLIYGNKNTIRVVVDNSQLPNSRWYTGSGIYRSVWLHITDRTHINMEGVKITTLSYSPARIQIKISHAGGGAAVEIFYQGQKVAAGTGDNIELSIPDAKLWSDESPDLYQCHVILLKDGIPVDEVTENFGIRKVEWSPKGLFINGKETLLRGGCVHHDNGILGACAYAESEERKVRLLKEAGYNAIRSSHNPASVAMLDACDKYGMYMMDETWDMWYSHKSKYDYATDFIDNYKSDIKAMVNRDYNHPSVIMYSIGNEISEPKDEKGVVLIKDMVALIHTLDKTRAVTAGINPMIISMASKGKGIYKEEGGMAREGSEKKQKATSSTLFNMLTSIVGTSMNKSGNSKKVDALITPSIEALDIAGYNYASGRYKLDGKEHPSRIVVGTETFPQDIAKNWDMVMKYPYLIGDFMWTAWDYLGEVGLGAWAYTKDGRAFSKSYPWLLAEAGAIDILGNIGAEAEYAAMVWGLRNKPYIGVRPVNHPGVSPAKAVWRGTNAITSWSWRGCTGNTAVIEVYSDADKIELFQDGKSLGKKKIKAFKVIFKSKYLPGTLTAVAYDSNGKELSRSNLSSATGKIKINATPEKKTIKVGQIVYINVSLQGENGVIESNEDRKLTVKVDGGELLAFGSANPRTEERYNCGSYTTYYGRAQAVVQSGKTGKISVKISGVGLDAATAYINVI